MDLFPFKLFFSLFGLYVLISKHLLLLLLVPGRGCRSQGGGIDRWEGGCESRARSRLALKDGEALSRRRLSCWAEPWRGPPRGWFPELDCSS